MVCVALLFVCVGWGANSETVTAQLPSSAASDTTGAPNGDTAHGQMTLDMDFAHVNPEKIEQVSLIGTCEGSRE